MATCLRGIFGILKIGGDDLRILKRECHPEKTQKEGILPDNRPKENLKKIKIRT